MGYHLFYARHYRELERAFGRALASATPRERDGIMLAIGELRRVLADDASSFNAAQWARGIAGWANGDEPC